MNRLKSHFNCIEVIAIRLFAPELSDSVNRLFNELKSGIGHADEGIVELSLYCHANIESDWEITIFRRSTEQLPDKTVLGLHLAASLSAFGLVHHEVWRCKGKINNSL